MKIIVDSGYILSFLEGNDKAVSVILHADERFVTIFDYALLLSAAEKTENPNHNIYIIKRFIHENFEVLEFSMKEVNTFAKLKSKYNISDIVLLNASIIINSKIKYLTLKSEYFSIKEMKKLIF